MQPPLVVPSQPSARRSRTCGIVAVAACLTYLTLAVSTVGRQTPTTPDAAHNLIVGRSLVQGLGYTVNLVPYHHAAFDPVRHVPEMHGLLQPLWVAALSSLFGLGMFAIQVPGFLYVAAAAGIAFALARRVFGPEAGLTATLLTLSNTSLLTYAWLGAEDVGFAFFVLAAVAFLHAGLTGGRDRDFLLAGLCAGLAIVSKPFGLFLPVVFAAVAIRWRRWPHRVFLRRGLLLMVPLLLFATLYGVRNVASHGQPQGRVGPLNMIQKVEGVEAVSAIFDEPPSLAATATRLGGAALAANVVEQLGSMTTVLFGWPSPAEWRSARGFQRAQLTVLMALAMLAALLAARRQSELVALFAAVVLGSGLFVCLLWHVEERLLALLIPFAAVMAAGLFGDRAWRRGIGRRAALVLLVGLVVAGLVGFGVTAGQLRQIASAGVGGAPAACAAAHDWLRRNTDPADRLLAMDPWNLAWGVDRETIMMPSGGVEAILRIARRYDARLLVVHRQLGRPLTELAANRLARAARGGADSLPGIVVRAGFESPGCSVYELDWRRSGATQPTDG